MALRFSALLVGLACFAQLGLCQTPEPPPTPASHDSNVFSMTCDSSSMTAFMNESYFNEHFNASAMHLRDDECVGYEHSDDIVAITTRYDECGTTSEQTESHIIYRNAVTYFIAEPISGTLITREMSNVTVDIQCDIPRAQLVGAVYQPSSPFLEVSEKGYGNFTVTFDRFTDDTFSEQLEDETAVVLLNEMLYFGMNMTASPGLTLFIDSCWSTINNDPLDESSYDMIQDGCVTDDTLEMDEDSSTSTFKTFSFAAFTFTEGTERVYLHCDVLVCFENNDDSRCAQGCVDSSRRRRAASPRGQSSVPHLLSKGPIELETALRKTQAKSDGLAFSNLGMVVAVSGVGCFVVGAVIAMVMVKLQRRRCN